MNELPRPQSMAEHLPTRRFALAVITGALLMGVAYGAMAGVGFVTDVRVPVVAITISALLTGFLAGRGGALAGFASWLVVSLAWALVVLVGAWVQGDLDRTFPGCDPCGLVGYAGRMAIVTLMSLGTFGVPAAIAGWLGEQAARRMNRVRRHA